MSALAVIRPDSWNFPLFLHVLGAMILVGATLTAGSALAFAGLLAVFGPRLGGADSAEATTASRS
jgi:hypothetical protein